MLLLLHWYYSLSLSLSHINVWRMLNGPCNNNNNNKCNLKLSFFQLETKWILLHRDGKDFLVQLISFFVVVGWLMMIITNKPESKTGKTNDWIQNSWSNFWNWYQSNWQLFFCSPLSNQTFIFEIWFVTLQMWQCSINHFFCFDINDNDDDDDDGICLLQSINQPTSSNNNNKLLIEFK